MCLNWIGSLSRVAGVAILITSMVASCTRRGGLEDDGGSAANSDPGDTDSGDDECGSEDAEVCDSYVSFFLECYGEDYYGYSEAELRAECQAVLANVSAQGCECRVAWENLLACAYSDCGVYYGCGPEFSSYAEFCAPDGYDSGYSGDYGDDGGGGVDRAAVDVDSLLANGVSVAIIGVLAEVTIPLVGSVDPDVEEVTLQLYLEAATSVLVTSTMTGVSVSLSEPWATYVEGTPSAIGEYTWSLNAERDTYRALFYNETPMGQMLKANGDYTVSVAVATNPYIETLDPTTFQLSVSE